MLEGLFRKLGPLHCVLIKCSIFFGLKTCLSRSRRKHALEMFQLIMNRVMKLESHNLRWIDLETLNQSRPSSFIEKKKVTKVRIEQIFFLSLSHSSRLRLLIPHSSSHTWWQVVSLTTCANHDFFLNCSPPCSTQMWLVLHYSVHPPCTESTGL